MPKELRISAVVALPDGLFEEAAEISRAEPLLNELRAHYKNVVITFDVITPKPRGTKPAPEADESGAGA